MSDVITTDGPELAEIAAHREQAFNLLCRLCGDLDNWRMSVPVQETDSDTILAKALDDEGKVIASLRTVVAERDELRKPPDSECWKKLIELAYQTENGALPINRITADYNSMKMERDAALQREQAVRGDRDVMLASNTEAAFHIRDLEHQLDAALGLLRRLMTCEHPVQGEIRDEITAILFGTPAPARGEMMKLSQRMRDWDKLNLASDAASYVPEVLQLEENDDRARKLLERAVIVLDCAGPFDAERKLRADIEAYLYPPKGGDAK